MARRTGVSIKALRFYDELGILQVAGRSDTLQ
ncbi:MAG: MerR family DNA-binding transcriptional regulator [Chloroflexi bacterium]|nr:MerR family DNA-binding transcriptional regulator [Chloroflexota bacterium]